MRTPFLIVCLLLISLNISAKNEIDSLLRVLDKTISERPLYASLKESNLQSLKIKKNRQSTLEQQYKVNNELIDEYQSFLYDSAVAYINKNIEIATQLHNPVYEYESKIKLSFVYSLSGLFTQALEILSPIRMEELPDYLKIAYSWSYIRYYENLIKYTDDHKFSHTYSIQKAHYRDTVISLLSPDSEEAKKEIAFKLQEEGEYDQALEIIYAIYQKQEPSTHGYAMAAMSLAKLFHQMGDRRSEEKYLIIAAITDTKLAVKENEALLSLAVNVNEKGDINRAYNYIKVALEDANFYNSRFRNTVIARVQPIIEEAYLLRIEQQSKNLRIYSILTSLFVVALAITIYFIYRQIKIVSRARRNLRAMNKELAGLNQKLDESNLIKEEYIGYFMNQCAVYIDKLDEYRKNINRKIKAGQIDDLFKLTSSTRNLEKDVEELYHTFDKAFLKLYPGFVEDFNALLREEERYKLKQGQLNTELRIFALIRLGITDANQISVFLRYSLQTIYNYKSKVKGKSIIDSDRFEEEVKKIGAFS